MVHGIIYKATNITNGKVYIGQTTGSLNPRIKNHFKCALYKKYPFYNALNKYKEENFIWEEIDSASSKEELDEKEIEWIWLNDSTNRLFGYNVCLGGRTPIKIDVDKAYQLMIAGKNITQILKEMKCDRKQLMFRLKSKFGKDLIDKLVKLNFKKTYKSKKRKKCISKEELQSYLDSKTSVRKIEKILGIPYATIKYSIIFHFGNTFFKEYIKDRNIRSKETSLNRWDSFFTDNIIKDIVDLYCNKYKSLKFISKKYGFSEKRISNKLKKLFNTNNLRDIRKKVC